MVSFAGLDVLFQSGTQWHVLRWCTAVHCATVMSTRDVCVMPVVPQPAVQSSKAHMPVQKELKEIARDQASGVTVRVVSQQSLHKLQGCLKGACTCCICVVALQSLQAGKSLSAQWLSSCTVIDAPTSAACAITHYVAAAPASTACLASAAQHPAGPESSPYAGGLFLIDIEIDNQYPYTPPKMRFITKVRRPHRIALNAHCCKIAGRPGCTHH